MAKRKQEENGHANGAAPATLDEAIDAPQHEERPPEPEGPPVNRPVNVFRFGSVKATVWLNQTSSGPRHAVTVTRRYKDEAGEWQNTSSFSLSDLLPLAKALDWAHSYISGQIANGDIPF